jgi:hypothetical protein
MTIPVKNKIPLVVDCQKTAECAVPFKVPPEVKTVLEGKVRDILAPAEAAGAPGLDTVRAAIQKLIDAITGITQTAHLNFTVHMGCVDFARMTIACSEISDTKAKTQEAIETTKTGTTHVPILTVETYGFELGDPIEKPCSVMIDKKDFDGKCWYREFRIDWYVKLAAKDLPLVKSIPGIGER